MGFDPFVGVNAEAVGGLFGSISYNFVWSTVTGFSDCFKTSGLYLEAFVQGDVTDLGSVTLSPFDDPSTTDKVETKKYILGYEGIEDVCLEDIGTSTASNSDVLTSDLFTLGMTEQEISAYISNIQNQFLENLRQQAKQLINDELQQEEPPSEPSVCAQVRISIDQEAVMTRSAFLGNLEIDNGNLTNLENLSVTLQIKDQNWILIGRLL